MRSLRSLSKVTKYGIVPDSWWWLIGFIAQCKELEFLDYFSEIQWNTWRAKNIHDHRSNHAQTHQCRVLLVQQLSFTMMKSTPSYHAVWCYKELINFLIPKGFHKSCPISIGFGSPKKDWHSNLYSQWMLMIPFVLALFLEQQIRLRFCGH